MAVLAFGQEPEQAPTAATDESAAGKVRELTLETFFTTITENEYVLMEFYASWCGHCKQFAPVYEEIASRLGGSVVVARIDADKHSVVASLQGIQGFPTIRFFSNGVPIGYTGDRTLEDVLKFVARATEPAFTTIQTAAEYDAFREANPKAVLACFGENATEIGHLKEMFEDIARQIHVTTDVSFAVYENSEAIGAPACPGFVAYNPDFETPFVYDIGTYLDVDPEDLPVPEEEEEEVKKENEEMKTDSDGRPVEIVPPGDEDHVQKEAEEEIKQEAEEVQQEMSEEGEKEHPKRSVPKIIRWISESMIPLVDEVSGRNFELYTRLERPMVWLVMKEPNEGALATFREVAKEYPQRASFVWLNDTLYHVQSKLIGVPANSPLPTVVISQGQRHYAFTAEQAEAFSFETVNDFVKDYFDGVLRPTIRSGPVPDAAENEAKAVKTIVRSQWDEVVRDPARDVLVEFYSFWCRNCLDLAGLFGEFAESLKDTKTFMMGNIELSENDFPEEIVVQNFPHLVLFPAGENSVPVTFEQDITVPNLIRFVQRNAGIKFELPEAAQKILDDEEREIREREEMEAAAEEEMEAAAEAEAAENIVVEENKEEL